MTNLLTAITLSFLVTNTETIYPTHQVPMWDLRPGTYAYTNYYSYRVEPDADPAYRDIIETVWRLETTTIPSLNLTVTNKQDLVSKTTTRENRVVTWKRGETYTNATETYITNSFYVRTGTLTNMTDVNWTIPLPDPKYMTNSMWGEWMTNYLLNASNDPIAVIRRLIEKHGLTNFIER